MRRRIRGEYNETDFEQDRDPDKTAVKVKHNIALKHFFDRYQVTELPGNPRSHSDTDERNDSPTKIQEENITFRDRASARKNTNAKSNEREDQNANGMNQMPQSMRFGEVTLESGQKVEIPDEILKYWAQTIQIRNEN